MEVTTTSATKPTFVTEVKTAASKPSSKDIPVRSRREIKTSARPKRDPEPTKHEYMDVLFGIVKQQVESYNARFQSSNKEDIDKMLEGLENYPIFKLQREWRSKLQQYGIVYARLLNSLITRRSELEKKHHGLTEILVRLREENNVVPQAVLAALLIR